LLRSTTGEGQDVDGKEDVLLAAVVAELHGFPAVAEESELGGGVTDLESHLGDFRFFALRGKRSSCECGRRQKPESDKVFH
jgi:hypothetical protein